MNNIRALPSSACPFRVLIDILETLGYSSVSECYALSSQPFLKHIFAFYLGQPHKVYDNCKPISIENLREMKILNYFEPRLGFEKGK